MNISFDIIHHWLILREIRGVFEEGHDERRGGKEEMECCANIIIRIKSLDSLSPKLCPSAPAL
jgi:hypothetical protein